MIALRKLLHEPLLHFLVLGAAVFAAFQLSGDRGEAAEGKIVITSGKIEHLVTGFSRTWRRPPTARELDGLVDDHVREEVFYREALAIGLDKDDTIVRRRMRQKLEFLAGDASAIVAPTDQELQAWLERNPDKFRVEPTRAFSQIYFAGVEKPTTAVARALEQLGGVAGESRVADLGDATMLPRDMPPSGVDEIGRVFGDQFAREVARLEPGHWAGPVQSGYGWHLVRVSERTDGGARPLPEVREAVKREWQAARSREVVDATYARLRAKYAITIEGRPTP
jgi:hypothetical protein